MFDGDAQLGPLNVSTFADQGVVEPTEAELDFIVQTASIVGVVIARIRAEDARKAVEAQLVSTQKFDALGRMAGEVAHDFNNLLVAIIGNAEVAADDLRDHPARVHIDMIRDAAMSASGLSRRLLAFSKGQVLDNRPLSLTPLVERSLDMLERLMQVGIVVERQLRSDTGVVRGDPTQLEQVVMNLVLNARDALPRGGHIVVETRALQVREGFIANHTDVSPGHYAMLAVTDDGEGLDAATQKRIFEPFFTTKPFDRGTGLGLSVVQGIVAQHGGHVQVHSAPGIGSTFKVLLPSVQERAVERDSRRPSGAGRLGGRERILVVDDDAHVRATVSSVLERAGYTVVAAENERDALRSFGETPPDLLVSDIVMRNESGLALAAKVTARRPEQRVLLMTGYAPTLLRDVPWPSIKKPFSSTELLARVRSVLEDVG